MAIPTPVFCYFPRNSNPAPSVLPFHLPDCSQGYERDACGGGPAALPTQVFEQVTVEIQEAIEEKIERNENRQQEPEGETDRMCPGFVFQATDYQHFREPYRGGGKLLKMPVPISSTRPSPLF